MEISVAETDQLLRSDNPPLLIDCREEHEYDHCRLEGAVLVPLSSFSGKAEALLQHADHSAIIYCHHGVRSLYAAQYLHQQGFGKTLSMRGGIDAWSIEIDTEIRRY